MIGNHAEWWLDGGYLSNKKASLNFLATLITLIKKKDPSKICSPTHLHLIKVVKHTQYLFYFLFLMKRNHKQNFYLQ